MKILQINATIGTGSVGRIVVGIYNELIQNGHDCKVAFGRGSVIGMPEKNAIRIGTENEVKLHALLSRITDKTGFYFAKSTEKLIKEIENYSPDIIHMHGNYGYYINIETLLKYLAKAKIPVVNTLHSCWDFTGHCCYFDYVGCDRWKTGCYNCPQKKSYPKSFVLDASKQNYQKKKELFMAIENMTIVTPSHWLEGLVKQSFLSNYPVEVIHNGIDLETFRPTSSNFREKHHCEDKIIVLGVANVWGKRKGLDTFIQLEKKLPSNYQIVLVGLNNRQKRKISNNIIGITQTNSIKELAEIYTAADVFVNPTLEDNFPTTNLEALACGTPVVTYKTGGSPESLNKECGIVVEKNNIVELIDILVKKTYAYKEENCIERSKIFNKEVRFRDYIRLYKELTKKDGC